MTQDNSEGEPGPAPRPTADLADQGPAEPARSDEEEAGWPRSWIGLFTVLAIVAIILVARFAGKSWRREFPAQRPAAPVVQRSMPPATRPARTPPLLDLRELQLPRSGSSCLSRAGTALPLQQGKAPPAACRLPLGHTAVRMEIVRAKPLQEIQLRVTALDHERFELYTALLPPWPIGQPEVWLSTNIKTGADVVLSLHHEPNTPAKLTRLRVTRVAP